MLEECTEPRLDIAIGLRCLPSKLNEVAPNRGDSIPNIKTSGLRRGSPASLKLKRQELRLLEENPGTQCPRLCGRRSQKAPKLFGLGKRAPWKIGEPKVCPKRCGIASMRLTPFEPPDKSLSLREIATRGVGVGVCCFNAQLDAVTHLDDVIVFGDGVHGR